MLLRIPALLTPDEVRHCRRRWKLPAGRTAATAGHVAAQVKSNLQLPLDSKTGQQIGDLILDRLADRAVHVGGPAAQGLLPRFNRYEGGGTYGNHIDNAFFTIPGTAIKVRTDGSPRSSSANPRNTRAAS
jgi:PKHD-type hydroxylase